MAYPDRLKTKELLYIGFFSAVAIALSYIERLIPLPLPLPGLKLGFANISILTCMIMLGFKPAIMVAIIKSLMTVLLFSRGSAFLYSFPATMVSIFVMGLTLFKSSKRFSEIGASVLGSVFFNTTQLLIASFIISDTSLLYIMPYMNLLSVFTGIFIGYTSKFLKEAIYKRGIL